MFAYFTQIDDTVRLPFLGQQTVSDNQPLDSVQRPAFRQCPKAGASTGKIREGAHTSHSSQIRGNRQNRPENAPNFGNFGKNCPKNAPNLVFLWN